MLVLCDEHPDKLLTLLQKRQTAVPLLTSLFNALTFFIPKQPNVTRESEPNVKEQVRYYPAAKDYMARLRIDC